MFTKGMVEIIEGPFIGSVAHVRDQGLVEFIVSVPVRIGDSVDALRTRLLEAGQGALLSSAEWLELGEALTEEQAAAARQCDPAGQLWPV